jgi:hypothetical protein
MSPVPLEIPTVSSVFTAHETGFGQAALDLFQGEKYLGMQVEEQLLPVGSKLTIFGELVKQEAGSIENEAESLWRGLELIKPTHLPFVASLKSYADILKDQERSTKSWKYALIICAGITLGAIAFRYRRQWNQRDETETKGDEAMCIVCYSHPREILFLECKHLQCCSQCASRLLECPVCRSEISNRLRIYQ